jgi:hypothetical protein
VSTKNERLRERRLARKRTADIARYFALLAESREQSKKGVFRAPDELQRYLGNTVLCPTASPHESLYESLGGEGPRRPRSSIC